jgi:16S rRNA G966 N2-methylase RsmD
MPPANRHTVMRATTQGARPASLELPEVRAEAFPPRYRIHKYWGKKPGNVIAVYIARFTDPVTPVVPVGATVLDLFAGSGVVLAEALLAGRRGIAVDLNPIASLITRVTVEGADPALVRAEGQRLLASLTELRAALFGERCARCGAHGEIVATSFVATSFSERAPTRLDLDCSRCGMVTQAPRACDARTRADGSGVPAAGAHPDEAIYPGWQMRKLVRAGIARWSELFTPRNLVAVAHLRRAIDAVPEPRVRRALLVSFTAHLAQASRMIADAGASGGGPSWKLNCYWLPPKGRELNPFRYFENRVEKTARGLLDMQARLGRLPEPERDYRVFTMSAERLGDRVAAGSADYVFTDPPYGGEGIQYGELSMLWNLWCGEPMCLDREVACNPRQQKDEAAFEARLAECMAAAFAALAPGGVATLTFANKEARVVEALRRACLRAGFSHLGDTSVRPSAPNVTNIVAPRAPKADLIVNFVKPIVRRRQRAPA